MCASLFEIKEYLSAFGIFRSVLQQVNQDPFQLFRIGLDLEFGSIDYGRNFGLYKLTDARMSFYLSTLLRIYV